MRDEQEWRRQDKRDDALMFISYNKHTDHK